MIKNYLSKMAFPLVVGALCFSSCSKSDNNGPEILVPGAEGKYIILTAESGQGAAGYYAAYNTEPSGTVDNVGGYSLMARAFGGFRHYKNWIFNRSTLSGEAGVVRYAIGGDGKIAQSGFIKCGSSAQNLVVDETTGFYTDPDRGLMKIQKFNPTLMERTGEIDLSKAIKDAVAYQIVGNQTLAAANGKLYVNVAYGTEKMKGFNDSVFDAYFMAVVDIATGKFEKLIEYPKVWSQGWPVSEYTAFTQAKDGTLYFLSMGWDYNAKGEGVQHTSKIFRIKAGETDFDKNWELTPRDFGAPENAVFWSLKEHEGKLFVDVSKDALPWPAMTNWMEPIFEFFSYNVGNKAITKITGLPNGIYGHSTGNIETINDDVYFRVVNTPAAYNGYYKLNADGKTASPLFNVSRGGQVKGFIRLTN